MALPFFFTHPIDYRGKACTFRERAFSFVSASKGEVQDALPTLPKEHGIV
jgi:hypothetical protein